jgi:hypothetical protein
MHGPQELSLKFVMAPEQEGNLIGRGVRCRNGVAAKAQDLEAT